MNRKSLFSLPKHQKNTLWFFAGVGLLVFMNLGTSLSVIYSKHMSRQLFTELQSLQRQRDELHVEWSQLLLEQGTWATDVRVERVAREHMSMTVPKPEEVMVFK